jgi:hypothetical protein
MVIVVSSVKVDVMVIETTLLGILTESADSEEGEGDCEDDHGGSFPYSLIITEKGVFYNPLNITYQ